MKCPQHGKEMMQVPMGNLCTAKRTWVEVPDKLFTCGYTLGDKLPRHPEADRVDEYRRRRDLEA